MEPRHGRRRHSFAGDGGPARQGDRAAGWRLALEFSFSAIWGAGRERRPIFLQHLLLQPGDGAVGRAALEGVFSAPRRCAGAKPAIERIVASGTEWVGPNVR